MATSPKWDADGTDYAILRNAAAVHGIERITTFDTRLECLAKWMEAIYRANPAGDAVTVAQGFYTKAGGGIFETVLSVEDCGLMPFVTEGEKSFEDLNKAVYEAEMAELAEAGGRVAKISLAKMNAFEFGQLMYFLQTSCDIAAAL